MGEQALNKKLAEWAGWTVAHGEDFGVYSNQKFEGITHWYCNPEGIPQDIADFTQSLDACFKWLVPKLQLLGYIVTVWGWEYRGFGASLSYVPKPYSEEPDLAETPALALCLAIEKLIDGEKEEYEKTT